MGIIRFLLALSVVTGHIPGPLSFKFTGGLIAVESFYMISGFYMALVINKYPSNIRFWEARYMRLFPVYFACALIALHIKGGFSYVENIYKLPYPANLFLIFTNITIFFQDLTMFIGIENEQVHFVADFRKSSPVLYPYLLIPQAWSLGLELSFYMLAPFILKQNARVIVIAIFLSILIKVTLTDQGLTNDPWTYRFFPSELSLFLVGSLMFLVYDDQTKRGRNISLDIALFVLVILSIAFFRQSGITKLQFYFILAISIGSAFSVSKDNRIDRFIGNLSYPIYCCHIIVRDLTRNIPFFSSDGSIVSY